MWPFQISSQNKVQLCCNLYQWFLQVIAVGRLCTHTDQISEGGDLLDTTGSQQSNSSPNTSSDIAWERLSVCFG